METEKKSEETLRKLEELSNRPNDWAKKLKNFVPTGIIENAEIIRSKHLYFPFRTKGGDLKETLVITEISYAWQLLEFYDWFFENIRTDLVVNKMLIKQAIVAVGSVTEALMITFLKKLKRASLIERDLKKIKFKGALETLKNKGIIQQQLYENLDELRQVRDYIHIHLSIESNKNSYSESDYFNHRITLESLSKAINDYCITLNDSIIR